MPQQRHHLTERPGRALLVVLAILTAGARPGSALEGTVTTREEGRVQVEIQRGSGRVPAVGDPVSFFVTMAGAEVEAGAGEVLEVDGDRVWVRCTGRPPALGSRATIEASGGGGVELYAFESICGRRGPPEASSASDFKAKPCRLGFEAPAGLRQSESRVDALGSDGEREWTCGLLDKTELSVYDGYSSFQEHYRAYGASAGDDVLWAKRAIAGEFRCLAWRQDFDSGFEAAILLAALCTDSADPLRRTSADGIELSTLVELYCEIDPRHFEEARQEAIFFQAARSLRRVGEGQRPFLISKLAEPTRSPELERLRLRIGLSRGRRGVVDVAIPTHFETPQTEDRAGDHLDSNLLFFGGLDRLEIDTWLSGARQVDGMTLRQWHRRWAPSPQAGQRRWREREIVGGLRCLADWAVGASNSTVFISCSEQGAEEILVPPTGPQIVPAISLRLSLSTRHRDAFDETVLLEMIRSITIRDLR